MDDRTRLTTLLQAKLDELRARGNSDFEVRNALIGWNHRLAEEHGIAPLDDEAVEQMCEPESVNPILAQDDDGLAAGLELTDREIGWNVNADLPACRRKGDDEWMPCLDGEARDEMLLAVQKAADIKIGNRRYPWRLPGRRIEDRVINVLARRNPFDGVPSEVYEKAHMLLGEHPPGCYMLTGELYGLVEVHHHNENPIRLDTRAKRDIKRAARDLGWVHDAQRHPATKDSRWWWISPGRPARGAGLLRHLLATLKRGKR